MQKQIPEQVRSGKAEDKMREPVLEKQTPHLQVHGLIYQTNKISHKALTTPQLSLTSIEASL